MRNSMKGIVAATVMAVSGIASAEYPVALHIDAPNSNGDIVWLSESGWGLNFKMVIKADDMIGFARHQNWTNKGEFGFIVMEDPDGCPWMDDADWRDNPIAPGGCPFVFNDDPLALTTESDEIYLEFRPDVDEAGMTDASGDADEMAELVDSAGSDGPEFTKDSPGDGCTPGTADADCFQFGPDTGGEVIDGFGYGNDDDLPGLFIYTEVGTGLMYNEPDFVQSSPRGVRNLAGMLNSITYDLSDITKTNFKPKGKGKPVFTADEEARVWAHMNVPGQLVRNIIRYDACTGEFVYVDYGSGPEFAGCDGDELWSIDGQANEVPPMNFGWGAAASIYQLENNIFTVHAFLVSGHAPDYLVDANGDGDYRDDAVTAGYTVISNKDSIQLIQLSNVLCWGGGGSVQAYDLDDNGESVVPVVCPTGPGDLGRPPR